MVGTDHPGTESAIRFEGGFRSAVSAIDRMQREPELKGSAKVSRSTSPIDGRVVEMLVGDPPMLVSRDHNISRDNSQVRNCRTTQ